MKTPFLRSAAMHGLLIGLCFIVFSLLDWALGFYGQKLAFSLLSYVIIFVGLLWSAITYRKKELGDYISYGQAFSYSMMVAVFYTLVSIAFGLLLTHVIDPEYSSKVMELTEQQLYEKGMSQEQIDMAMEMSARFSKPGLSTLFGFIANMVVSAIIALITSAIAMRKNPNPFTGQE